jgi:hypothetical protein
LVVYSIGTDVTTMPDYFEATDGHGESCVWVRTDRPDFPMPVIRQREVMPGVWPDVVARMTGTTITTDDATVQLVADAISREGGEPGNSLHGWRCEYPDRYGKCECLNQVATGILAALTGGAT